MNSEQQTGAHTQTVQKQMIFSSLFLFFLSSFRRNCFSFQLDFSAISFWIYKYFFSWFFVFFFRCFLVFVNRKLQIAYIFHDHIICLQLRKEHEKKETDFHFELFFFHLLFWSFFLSVNIICTHLDCIYCWNISRFGWSNGCEFI